MATTTIADRINQGLEEHGYDFERTNIQYGCQFRFDGGDILNVFDTQRTNWQGVCTDLRTEVDKIIAQARGSLIGPGIFRRA